MTPLRTWWLLHVTSFASTNIEDLTIRHEVGVAPLSGAAFVSVIVEGY
jgi:hypothetical protein